MINVKKNEKICSSKLKEKAKIINSMRENITKRLIPKNKTIVKKSRGRSVSKINI